MGAAVKIVAGAALVAAAFFVPAAGVLGIKILSAALIGSIGASVSLGGIAQALQKPQSGSLLGNPRGRTETIRQAAAARWVLYGYCRVGGVLSFANSHGLRIAPTDQVQLVITIAGHSIASIQATRFGDDTPELADGATGAGVGAYFGKAFIQPKYGDDGDLTFPSLGADSQGIWSDDHRQRGCAGAYVRLNYDEKLYPGGAIPNITFEVEGKRVFDPRTDSPITVVGATNASPIVIEATGHGLSEGDHIRIVGVAGNTAANGAAWYVVLIDADHFSLLGSAGNGAYTSGGQIFRLTYTNNAALVTADYLLDPWIGMGVPYSKIRESVLIAAANVCDEPITLPDASTEPRYTINGAFETSEQHGEILAQMANAMAGHVTYIGGEWHIIPGAFRLPVMELTDDDVVAPMHVSTKRSKRDLFNGIKGTFPSAAHNFVETDFPAITGDTYLAEDLGVRVWKDIFLPFTTTATACQRLAGIELERNRRQITVRMACSMRAYELQPGDVVEFTHSRYSWALETFEVAEFSLEKRDDGALVCNLQLVQTDVDVYGFAVDDYGNLIDPDLLDLLSRKVPFGWSPGMAHRPDSSVDALRPRADYNFGMTQQYQLKADGSMLSQLLVAGFIPTNLLSQEIRRPRTKNLAATTASTGGFLAGGNRYYIAVAARDAVTDGRFTALSEVAVVDVPAGTNTNTVTIHDLRWDAATAEWWVFFGTDKFRLSNQPGAIGVTQPTSITFAGLNVPLQLPDGYFEHLRGAPDHRFDKLRIRATRAIHLGIWGGQVVSTGGAGPYTVTLGVDPSFPFTTNVMAGRYVMLVGTQFTFLDLATGSGGMPLAEFLIDSNDGTTLTLAAGQADPSANGFVLGAVVVICTKATAVSSDVDGNYIEDTGFGQGGQDLGDQDPNLGGGDDSLIGKMLRIIAGTGAGTKAIITGNNVAAKTIHIVGEWDVTPDTTSVFIVTDAHQSATHDSDPLGSEKSDAFVSVRMDVANLQGEQYLIQVFTVSPQGRESHEDSSPYRFIYFYGSDDPGEVITTDTVLTSYHRYVRVDCSAASPPAAIQLTMLDAAILPGRDTTITKIDVLPLDVTIATPGGHTNSFGSTKILSQQWDATTLRAYDDA